MDSQQQTKDHQLVDDQGPIIESQAHFDIICSKFPLREAQDTSAEERFNRFGELDFMISPFTYGEIRHDAIAEVLLFLKLKHGLFTPVDNKGIFYDLGSGIGKPSVTAALTLPEFLGKCVGIELLETMYKKSLELAEEYHSSSWYQQRDVAPKLLFESYDFLQNHQEWSQADVVFANATCFEDQMLSQLQEILTEKFNPGSVLILTTKKLLLDNKLFEEVGPFRKTMSWGMPTDVRAYIRRKT